MNLISIPIKKVILQEEEHHLERYIGINQLIMQYNILTNMQISRYQWKMF